MHRSLAIRAEQDSDQYVPFRHHVTPTVISTDDQSLIAVYRVDGLHVEAADAAETQGWHNRLNVLARNIASDRLILSVHIVRRQAAECDYPMGRFRSAFSRRLDDAYRGSVLSQLYRNDMFLSITRLPTLSVGSDRVQSWLKRKRNATPQEPTDNQLKHLEETCRVLEENLIAYGLTRLGIRQEEVQCFSEIAEALHLILMGEPRRVPLTTGRLGRAVHQCRVVFGREVIRLYGDVGTRFGATLAIKEYPAQTWAGQFNRLLAAPYFFSLTQSFGFLSKPKGMGVLTRKQNQMVSSGDPAHSQIAGLVLAADHLMSNLFVMGSHHLAMTVFGYSLPELDRVVARARSDLADSGAVVAREDLGLEAAYWSQLPGNARLRTRPGVISSINWAGLCPLHGYPQGAAKGYWGDPVALFRTTGGTPYRFHFHVGDLGNIFIAGPSGSGKTTLLLFLLAQAEKLNVTTVLFDSDRGGEILSRALGGTYLVLPSGKPTGMAPLRALSDTPQDTTFLIAWITALIQAGGYKMRPDDDRRIAQGVESLLALPPEHRSLSEMRAFLGQQDDEGAGSHLDRWCAGGALGWAFDGDADKVNLDAPFLGFDMTAILSDKDVRGPAMAYLFHRVESLLDGRRLVLAVDEFWAALADPAFRDMANEKLKTIRKKNGVLIMATQSPRDALNSPIAHSIIEQSPTQILMPNTRADTADYVDGLKLTATEFRMVSQDLTVGGHRFLLKQGTASVACDLDLSDTPDSIAVLSGRRSTVGIMEKLIESSGPDPELWIDDFLARAKEHVH